MGSARSAVPIVFVGENVREDYLLPTPDVAEAEGAPTSPCPPWMPWSARS